MAALFEALSWSPIACRQASTGSQALCRYVFVGASLLANGGDKRAVASLEDSLAGKLLQGIKPVGALWAGHRRHNESLKARSISLKVGLWLITAWLLFIWTAGMALMAQLLPWLAVQLPQWAGALPPLDSLPWPTWLGPWVDAAWLQAMQSLLSSGLQWLAPMASILPSMDGVAALLNVALWLLWGFGLVLLLGLAVTAHVLFGRRQRRAAA